MQHQLSSGGHKCIDGKNSRVGFKMNEGVLNTNTSFLLDHGCLAIAAAKPSSYASSHHEVSELTACLEKTSFSCTSGHVKVYKNLLLICHP
nr:hypothetical protein [Tanacetum cinerariifolium]